MTITSPKELTAVINGRGNKLAGRAIRLIKFGGSLEVLKSLVSKGCPDFFIERDPSHPRTQYHVVKVLDACFTSEFGIISRRDTAMPDGGVVHSASLGAIHHSEGREVYFDYLLNEEFSGGSNNWRGALFPHIMDCAFDVRDSEKQASAMKFAKILLAHGKVAIQEYVAHSYSWIGAPAKLKIALELGANPNGSAMIDCALNYVGCSPSFGDTRESRIQVVKDLIELGAIPSDKRPFNYQPDFHRYCALEKSGLLSQMIAWGAISDAKPYLYDEKVASESR